MMMSKPAVIPCPIVSSCHRSTTDHNCRTNKTKASVPPPNFAVAPAADVCELRVRGTREESPMASVWRAAWHLRLLLLATALVAWHAASPARADYPERQITLIACFPAGGG